MNGVGATGADPARRRSLRKEDLLLASQLARGQAMGAFDDLAGRADAVALRVVRVRLWLSDPRVQLIAAAGAGVVLAVVLRRKPATRWLRWGWLRWGWRAWRLWRSAGPRLTPHHTAGG